MNEERLCGLWGPQEYAFHAFIPCHNISDKLSLKVETDHSTNLHERQASLYSLNCLANSLICISQTQPNR